MSEAGDEVIAALVALLVLIILVVAGLSVCFYEDTSVVGVPLVPSAQGVPEPL